ncbi:3-methyl-2-oxobutanoate hydroxymethyltransferase [Mesorhizobium sp. L-8-10]|uniref:3-methyl-2-oxobutanoate hydroxymethyltransferase n=1 Tax=Mesorhizobium sp. L-8-10 TaxID=2744523 RepID=UPI001925BA4F|nr:3-methyl-2-oxobutanoate hydroxymethyltransferase [Mesorhizobium sp. L-8-10]BCH29948.1 3-methyl-2-oxobutanoate hydroxymethyltransferase [Mesorhizobium sp. L-8-10]
MPRSLRPTVADLLRLKGQRQLVMLRVTTLEEAEAAQRAGVEMLSVTPELMTDRSFRDAAPDCFAVPGGEQSVYTPKEDCLREAFRMMRAGADAVYCAAGLDTIRALRAEAVPVCGHCGLVPSQATWTGGFRAVGKTAAGALSVWKKVRDLEAAGAFAAEIEVVPAEVAAAISGRTSLFMISMGAGDGCDAQYLFAEDVLGQNRGRYPRHARSYRNFAAEFDRLQQERATAFAEFAADVRSGRFPQKRHQVGIDPAELSSFLEALEAAQ